MKRYNIILILAGVLLSSAQTATYAGTVNGTTPAVDGKLWAIGLEYEFLSNRDLESSDISSGKIRQSDTFYGKVTCHPMDPLYMYLKAGIIDLKTKMTLTNGKGLEEDFEYGFYTGGGAKLVYELMPRFKIAIDNQLNWFMAKAGDMQYDSVASSNTSGDITVWEYQFAGIVSYTIDCQPLTHSADNEFALLIPYIGLTYAYLDMDSGITATISGTTIPVPGKRENENKVGVVVGADFTVPVLHGFTFNAEGRFIDGLAASLSLNYQF